MKKSISLFLSIILLLTCSVGAFADDDFTTPIVPIGEEIRVTVSVSGYQGAPILEPTAFDCFDGESILAIVRQVMSANSISYTLKDNYISEIAGLKELDYGKYSGWMYQVNGIYPNVSMDAYFAEGNDTIALVYVDTYTPVNIDIAGATVSGVGTAVYTGGKLTRTPKVSFGNTVLTAGTDYTLSYENNIAIGTASMIITGKGTYYGRVKKSFNIVPAKPAVTVKSVSESTLTLAWKAVKGASLYRVYRYYPQTGKYKLLTELTGTSASYKKLASGASYILLVRAGGKTAKGDIFWSTYAAKDQLIAVTLCKAPTVKTAVSGKTVTLRWSKVDGAKFYRVYSYNAKTKKYTTLLKQVTAKSATLGRQAKGTHYYLVRAFNANAQGSAYSTKRLIKTVVR